jgi:5'-nucleotidase (lipoprotein e(P4) family)
MRALPLLAVLLACCSSARTPPPVAPAPIAPASAKRELSPATRWVLRSAEYRAACMQSFRDALRQVSGAAATRAPGSWAVILDADETVISNAQYQKEAEESGREETDQVWSEWVAREAATPVPGAAEFLAQVRALGGRIAIVTNRSEADCPPTQAVFRKHGLPYDVMLCKPEGQPQKDPRFERVIRGEAAPGLPALEVLAWIGDNIRDFPAGSQDWRRTPQALRPFGERYFVIPNPMYGSWEDLSE